MDNPMFWPLMAFLALSLVIGVSTARFVHRSGRRFLICGKSMPFIVIGTTLVAQALDGNATLGNTGLTYAGGFWSGMALSLGLGLSLFFVGKFLAEPLNRMDLITLPEFFFRRYGRGTELATSVVTFVSFSILLAGNLAALGWILSVTSGWSYAQALSFGAAIVFTYTVAGGLYAAIWTDFVQIYIAVGGFLLLAGWLYWTQDWQGALAALPPAHLNLEGLTSLASGGLVNWSVILSLTFGNAMALDFMERVFTARTPKIARTACYYAGTLTIIAGVAAAFAGLMAHQMVGVVEDSRMVLPVLASQHVPYWVGVMTMIGVVGASMSTCCGVIIATSAVVSRNILQRWSSVVMDDEFLLRATRLVAIPMTAGGALFAYYRPEPGVLLVLAFDIVFAGCVVPLVAGVYWKRANAAGALAAIIVGTSARVVAHYLVPASLSGLDTLLPPVIGAVAFFAACLLAPEPATGAPLAEGAAAYGLHQKFD
jgi:Na+/proline symporter